MLASPALAVWAHSPTQFIICRFLTGLGIGGEFAAGAALVAETFPSHSRTAALGVVQATSALGNVAAGLIWRLFGEALGWRGVFFLGVIPALLLFVILFFIKEPEAWKEKRRQSKEGGVKLGNMLNLFTEPLLRRNTFVGVTLAAVGVTLFWGVGTWSSELIRGVINPNNLPELSKKAEDSVSYVIMAQNGGAFFGALAFAYLAQRFGRKPAFIAALLACGVSIPTAFHFTNSMLSGILLFALMGFSLLILFGGYAVYFPELFPTRLRSTGTGFCYNVARFISAFAPMLLGGLATAYGLQKAVLMVSSVFILGLLVMPFAPETKDRPLPE